MGGGPTNHIHTIYRDPTNVYLLNTATPKTSLIRIMRQKRNHNQSVGDIEFIYQSLAEVNKAPAIPVASAALFVDVFATVWRLRNRPE